MLLLPDLLVHWLTGVDATERTNASTTGLLDVTTGEWCEPIVRRGGDPSVAAGAAARPGHAGRAVAGHGARGDRPAGPDGGHDGRLARHGERRGRGPRGRVRVGVRRVRHVGAGRRRAGRAGADRGEPTRRLHQRGGRRRHRPLPAQRHGAVGPVRGAADLGGSGARARPRRAAGRRGAPARGRSGGRHRRSRAPAARRHGRPRRRAVPRDRPAGAVGPGGHRALHPRQPGRGVRAGGRRRRAAVGAARRRGPPRRWRGSQPAAVPADGGRAGRTVVAGPVEATALGNVLVQARAHGDLRGGPGRPA